MSNQTYPQALQTRYIVIKLILDSGQFPSSTPDANGLPQNVKILYCNSDQNNLSTEITITKASGFMQCSAYVIIYGMNLADCNAFSRFNITNVAQLVSNRIEIYAGYSVDSTGIPPLCYSGQIYIAGVDMNNPSRPFKIQSLMGVINQNTPAPTTNPQGSIQLNDMLSSMVKLSGAEFVYKANNVTGTVENVVYEGSWVSQLQQACNDYGYQMKIDNNNVLVTQIGQPYDNNVYSLSADSGMLGYPNVEEFGISCRTRYNPGIQFGQQISITSELPIANGSWYINGLTHTLQNRGPKFESLLKLNTFQFNLPPGF